MEFIAKDQGKGIKLSSAKFISEDSIQGLSHVLKIKILKALITRPMYPAEIAKKLCLHEQKVYYHIKQMHNAGILKIVEKQEIRGTTAKKFAPVSENFAVSFSKTWEPQGTSNKIPIILKDFCCENVIDANIVVGSPDPHGPYKARARDGHYAIDLALYLGTFFNLDHNFVTRLDVDINLKSSGNLILVGGPVTNLICSRVNKHLPVKFSDKKPWGIVTENNTYTDESVGMIAKIKNPFNDSKILLIAGIRFIGTKAAVLAFTRYNELVLKKYNGQDEFSCIVQGFDMDGDGKLDNIEVLE